MLVKITPLNVQDKTPRFSTMWQFLRAFYSTYKARYVTTLQGDDFVIYYYQNVAVIRVEPVENLPQGVNYAA